MDRNLEPDRARSARYEEGYRRYRSLYADLREMQGRINELAEVYARNEAEDGLYFEVQVWDPEILEHWRAVHDIP